MSRYLFEDEVLGFLASDDSEEEEISVLDWISIDYGEEDREEISSYDSSSEDKRITNYVPLFLQTTSFPKPKRGKQHLLQIMLVEQLRIMSFDKVQVRQGLQNSSAQKQVIILLYFCGLLIEKPYVSGLITKNHSIW